MLPTKTHINIKTDQVTMKREERYIWKHHKKAGVAILISEKVDFSRFQETYQRLKEFT